MFARVILFSGTECQSSRASSLNNSYNVRASFREVWRVVGRERTRILVNLSRERTTISSPVLTAWEDLAKLPLIETRPASQIFWATVRREQSRLALRKRSRRITRIQRSSLRRQSAGADGRKVFVHPAPGACSCLLRFRNNSEQLALLLFSRLLSRRLNAIFGCLFRREVQ